ncbi:MAG TPA: LPS assembly lipoprotein LptE [Nitrospiraceae bacterium]|nr:LPS assembly lipoprotein LptE [Nitrospiraceae bacterium]
MSLLPFTFCLLTMNIAGCGYQFRVQGAGPTVGGAEAKPASTTPPPRMAIRTFDNRTYEANLEVKLTNYIRREFSGGTGTQIVGESEPADLLMTGQVLGILLPTLSFDQTTTFESRVELLISVRVQEMRTKRIVWSQILKGQSEFFITQDLQFNRVLQNRALEQAGKFVAEDAASRYLVFLESGQLEAAMRRNSSGSRSDGTDAAPSRSGESPN